MANEAARTDLRAEMAALAREMQREHSSVEQTLQAITHTAIDKVAGATHAGVTLVVGRRKVESRAATSALPRELDELQERLGEGPCLQAAWEHETVHAPDMEHESRWPRFASAAFARGIGAMMSFELFTEHDNLGALNLYGSVAHAFTRESYDTGFTLATHAAIALLGAQRQSEWQSALATRDIIGQAKGMIMERYNVDAVRAFNLLARLSQDANIKVEVIAPQLVEREHPLP